MAGNVARIGDPISCGDYVATASSDVFINGMPVAGGAPDDLPQTTGHDCYPPTYFAVSKEVTVFVNGRPAAIRGKTRIRIHFCGLSWHDGIILPDTTPSAEGGVSFDSP
jgi:uncharacterized Zn-binding protein involved in type VI secretion